MSLANLAERLPVALLPGEAVRGISLLADLLPDAFGTIGLEWDLSVPGAPPALLGCTLAGDGGARRLARSLRSGATALKSRAWQGASRFVRSWNQSDSDLNRSLPLLWLEFDNLCGTLDPGLLVCVNPAALPRSPWPGFLPPIAMPRLLSTVLRSLVIEKRAREVLPEVQRCFDALPEGGAIVHVAAMLQRRGQPVKLNVRLPRDQLASYLCRVGWGGDLAPLARGIDRLCGAASELKIDLALDARVRPYVGVELLVDRERMQAVDRCADEGICDRRAREVLRAWPGSERLEWETLRMPARLAKWVEVKLLFRPGSPVGLKAYLGMQPHFSLF